MIRMAWAADLERIGPAAAGARIVKEYRQIPAPAWEARRT